MGNDITNAIDGWLQTHNSARKFIHGLVVFGIGFLIAQQAEIIAGLPSWLQIVAGALILAAHNWAKYNIEEYPGYEAPAKSK